MPERFELNSVQMDDLDSPNSPRFLFGIEMIQDDTGCKLLDIAHERRLSASEVSLFHLAMTGYLKEGFVQKPKNPPRIPRKIERSRKIQE